MSPPGGSATQRLATALHVDPPAPREAGSGPAAPPSLPRDPFLPASESVLRSKSSPYGWKMHDDRRRMYALRKKAPLSFGTEHAVVDYR
jgi:hypothetical protein